MHIAFFFGCGSAALGILVERPCTRASPRERGQDEAGRMLQGRQTVEQACEPGAAPVIPGDEGPAGGVPHRHVIAEPAERRHGGVVRVAEAGGGDEARAAGRRVAAVLQPLLLEPVVSRRPMPLIPQLLLPPLLPLLLLLPRLLAWEHGILLSYQSNRPHVCYAYVMKRPWPIEIALEEQLSSVLPPGAGAGGRDALADMKGIMRYLPDPKQAGHDAPEPGAGGVGGVAREQSTRIPGRRPALLT